MTKLIRECRMGPPKSFKTGAVVGTYPKPMLVFLFDSGDLDVIPSKDSTSVQPPEFFPIPLKYEEMEFNSPGQMAALLAKGTQPPVSVLDYSSVISRDLDLAYAPTKSNVAMDKFQSPGYGDYNVLSTHLRNSKPLPWKTIVFASITGYMDAVLNHMSMTNPGALSDARNWASYTGGKVRQLVLSAVTLPCHVVFIAHTVPPESDETTKITQELPNVYSKLKAVLGGLFSQYFYSMKQGNKAVVSLSDYMYVKGVGTRWPAMVGTVGADFQSIYGKEGLV